MVVVVVVVVVVVKVVVVDVGRPVGMVVVCDANTEEDEKGVTVDGRSHGIASQSIFPEGLPYFTHLDWTNSVHCLSYPLLANAV